MSKKYNNLLLSKSENLTIKQEHRLNQILFEFDPKGYLREVYLGKDYLSAYSSVKLSILLPAEEKEPINIAF